MNKAEAKKQELIQPIMHYLIAHGFADVGLRTLAAVADTSDRMLIYYFETKDALISETLQTIVANLTTQLDALLGTHQRSAETLLAELLEISGSPQFFAVVQLWFELVGLAARGEEPYASNTTALGQAWLNWVESRLEAPQEGEAAAVFAELEGRLLLKLINLQPPHS